MAEVITGWDQGCLGMAVGEAGGPDRRQWHDMWPGHLPSAWGAKVYMNHPGDSERVKPPSNGELADRLMAI